jgi:hypothetical protein
MGTGTGTIRLRGVANVADLPSGRHVLTYFNPHHPEASVYLANAMVPADKRITISSQHRDPSQSQLTLEYDLAYAVWPKLVLPACALVIIALRCGLPMRLRRWRRRSTLTSRTAC